MASQRMEIIFRHLDGRGAAYTPRPSETSAVTEHPYPENFRYTLNNPLLSQGQRKFFEDNGYLVIPHLIEDDILDACCQRFDDVCEGRVPRGSMTMMKEMSLAKTNAAGQYLYYKLQDIVWDDVMSNYFLHPKILDYVECFIGPNIKAVHTMFINKPPDSGKLTSVHPLHQDLHYFPFRPADRIVAAWTAVERVNEDNGCLVVIPGSHKGKLLPHGYPKQQAVNKAFHQVEGFEDYPVVPLPMEKGDTVFFHPILVHGSGINKTKGFRKAISCHYASSECYYIDVEGTTQEIIAREVEQMVTRKGFNCDFQDVWRYRSRLVRGEEHTL